jgi:hypothetical protein
MPFGKLNLKASKKKFEKLLDRIRTREISVDDLMAFDHWARKVRDYPDEDWCRDFGTFKAVGKGFELATFLSRDQPCWGQQLN